MTRPFAPLALGILFCAVLCVGLPIDSGFAQEAKPDGDQKARQGDRQSQQQGRQQKGRTRPGQKGGTQKGGRGMQRGGRGGTGEDGSLVVGEMAPDFNLKALEGDEQTQLSSFKGKKPVILFFGSYT